MTAPDVVLLSVQSPHIERLLAGTKTVEFRRRPLNLRPGTVVLLYASGTRRELAGSFVAGPVRSGTPTSLWRQHGAESGLTRAEYDDYFAGTEIGYAVPALEVRPLSEPIPLGELRQRWPRFTTPQTHRRVAPAELDCILNGERALLLGPRSTS